MAENKEVAIDIKPVPLPEHKGDAAAENKAETKTEAKPRVEGAHAQHNTLITKTNTSVKQTQPHENRTRTKQTHKQNTHKKTKHKHTNIHQQTHAGEYCGRKWHWAEFVFIIMMPLGVVTAVVAFSDKNGALVFLRFLFVLCVVVC